MDLHVPTSVQHSHIPVLQVPTAVMLDLKGKRFFLRLDSLNLCLPQTPPVQTAKNNNNNSV